METQDSKLDMSAEQTSPRPFSRRARILSHINGLIFGFLSYPLIGLVWLGIFGGIVFDARNTDAEMDAVICGFFPTLVMSTLAGGFGGKLGYKKGLEFLGSALGGLCGPVIVFSISTLLILIRYGKK